MLFSRFHHYICCFEFRLTIISSHQAFTGKTTTSEVKTTINVLMGSNSSQVISHVFVPLLPNHMFIWIINPHYFPDHTVPTSSVKQSFISLFQNYQWFVSLAAGSEVQERICLYIIIRNILINLDVYKLILGLVCLWVFGINFINQFFRFVYISFNSR